MIAIFFAEGFEEVEALTPLDYLRRCELDVVSVGVGSKLITGAHGISITCDMDTTQFDPTNSELEMVILPGGMPGTTNLDQDEIVHAAITYCHAQKRYLAAICAAPSILGKAGFLHGKRAVCYRGFEQQLVGAKVKSCGVCTDGNIITAASAGYAQEFAFAIVESLLGASARKNLQQSLLLK